MTERKHYLRLIEKSSVILGPSNTILHVLLFREHIYPRRRKLQLIYKIMKFTTSSKFYDFHFSGVNPVEKKEEVLPVL